MDVSDHAFIELNDIADGGKQFTIKAGHIKEAKPLPNAGGSMLILESGESRLVTQVPNAVYTAINTLWTAYAT